MNSCFYSPEMAPFIQQVIYSPDYNDEVLNNVLGCFEEKRKKEFMQLHLHISFHELQQCRSAEEAVWVSGLQSEVIHAICGQGRENVPLCCK